MNSNCQLEGKPQQKSVYLRCVFLKIRHIDTVNEQYYADVFLQAKWREPLLDSLSDDKDIDLNQYWKPELFIENLERENKVSNSLEVIYPDRNGQAYLLQKRRLRAVFHETLELMQFPFDCQDLSVTVASDLSSDEVSLEEQEDNPSLINTIDAMESQEWSIHTHVEVTHKEINGECNTGPKKRQSITFTCRASRRFGYCLINYFLISCMFFLLTFCSFAVTQNTFGRLQLCMINLLTSVTFKVAVSNNLPKVPYLTYLDQVILSNIFMIMCVCFWHASISTVYRNSSRPANVTDSEIWNIEVHLIPSILAFYILAIVTFGVVIYFDAGSRRREMRKKDSEFNSRVKRLASCIEIM